MLPISFAYPLVLILLVLPLGLVIWTWKRPGRRITLPVDHGGTRKGHGWRILLNAAETLPALVLAVIILILAGPQTLSEPKTKRSLTNIEFCVDISGSMTAPFGEGTRYDASMKAINEFIDARKGDAFGLTFFGNNFMHFVPLTTDASAFKCAPPLMRPESAPPGFGGTQIAKALLGCKEVLTAREEGDRMIVLVSDGFSSDLDGGNDLAVAKQLQAVGISVFAIHTAESEVPGEIVNLCSAADGEAFPAGDTDALKFVFERIDRMKQAKLEKTQAETMDDFLPYCIAGLSLLGLCGGALFGLRYTPW